MTVLSTNYLFHRSGTNIGLTLVDYWMASPSLVVGTAAVAAAIKSSRWFMGKATTSEALEGLARTKRHTGRITQTAKQIVLLHLGIFAILPPIWTIMLSLSPGNSLSMDFSLSTATLEHYRKMWESDRFWGWLWNSIVVSVATTIFGLTVAFPAAYGFSRYRFHGRKLGLFMFLIVQMFPGALILVPYFIVMKGFGLLNTYVGLVVAYSVTALPLCVWLMKGFFDTIPRELEEAARVDGCSQLQIFTRIIFPLSLPAVAVTCLFSFLAAWNEYLLALTFLSDTDRYTLPVGLASMVSSAQAGDSYWGDFAAASILISIPVVLLFVMFQRYLVDGMVAGAVKG
jgi:arabinogalactan oligomer/maltooligosaccharide transport system permease protein